MRQSNKEYITIYRIPDNEYTKEKIPLPTKRKIGRPPDGALNCPRCKWQVPSDPLFCLACGLRINERDIAKAGGNR